MKVQYLVVLSALVLGGCAGGEEAGGTDQADATSAAKHRQALDKCVAARDAAVERDENAEERVDIEITAATCARKANDGVVARLEKNLKAADSERQGTVKDSFAGYRSETDAVCGELYEPGYTGPLESYMLAQCLSDRELQLGRLVDAWSDLGVATTAIDAEHEDLTSCLAAADDDDRHECLTETTRLGAREAAENHNRSTGYTPNSIDGVKDRFEAVVLTHLDSQEALCRVLVEAGKKSAPKDLAACRVNATVQLYVTLRTSF